jgi:cytochrome o ubiquinol oxidase subunit 1
VPLALPISLRDLHLPRNTPVGIFVAFFAVILGFALIWRIEWLAAVGLIGAVAVALREFWKTDREELVPAQEVAAFELAHATPGHRVPAGDFDELLESGDDRRRVRVAAEGES